MSNNIHFDELNIIDSDSSFEEYRVIDSKGNKHYYTQEKHLNPNSNSIIIYGTETPEFVTFSFIIRSEDNFNKIIITFNRFNVCGEGPRHTFHIKEEKFEDESLEDIDDKKAFLHYFNLHKDLFKKLANNEIDPVYVQMKLKGKV